MVWWKLGIRIISILGIFFILGSLAYSYGQNQTSQLRSGAGKVFVYTATRFGVPFLKATIKIEDGSIDPAKFSFPGSGLLPVP